MRDDVLIDQEEREQALRLPPRRRRERPVPGESLAVEHPAIEWVMDREDGRHLAVKDVIGADYVRLMQLRMDVNTSVQRGDPLYVCSICNAAVRIRRSPKRPKFFFKHRHEDGNCPAITAGELSQAEIDARKYNGAKESRLHKRMKDWIAQCLGADSAFSGIEIEPTWTGALTGERRRPDVRATYKGLRVAFEVQLSTTHLDVISARRDFYMREGGLLFWVFAEFNSERRRMTDDDVFYNNNLNAFVVNADTVAASLQANQFKLECVWVVPVAGGDTSGLHRRLTSFHELTLQPEQQHAYYFDYARRRQQLQAAADSERHRLRDEFEQWIGQDESSVDQWPTFRSRFKRFGVDVPSNYWKLDDKLLIFLYSAKNGRPWGWRQPKLVSAAHRIADAYKHHLEWFMHAARHYGRINMLAEDGAGAWTKKYGRCVAEQKQSPALYEPRRESQELVEFLFPELVPFP